SQHSLEILGEELLNTSTIETCHLLADETLARVSPASRSTKRKRPRSFLSVAFINAGNDLLSHTLSRAVQSALRGLTSLFGMGTGGSPPVKSPTKWAVSYQPAALSLYRARTDGLLIQQAFKEREDDSSQLNRWGQQGCS